MIVLKNEVEKIARWCYSFIRPRPAYYQPVTKIGVCTDTKRRERVVVSLTSFPARIKTVSYTIDTLLSQNVKPDKVVLWLAESQFPKKESCLPAQLIRLRKYGLEIRWTKDTKSYKKIIPTLIEFPNDIIITVDDDVYYPPSWLGLLLNAYERNPNVVHCHRAHLMKFDAKNLPLSYDKWGMSCAPGGTIGYDVLQTGVGGVLYPPHCFYKDVIDEEKFISIASSTDDIWLWAMCVLNKTPIHVVDGNIVNFEGVFNVRKDALWNINHKGYNDIVLKSLFKYYPELQRLLMCDKKECY